MDSVQKINSYLCFFVGSALNLTLLWLIIKRSSDEARPYARILLQTVVIDLVFLTMTFLYSPVLLIGNGRCVIYGVGPLSVDNINSKAVRHWNFSLYAIWNYTFFFIQHSITVPFIHRYFTICRDRVLSLRTYSMLLVAVGLVSAVSVPIVVLVDASNSEVERMNASLVFFGGQPKQTISLIAEVSSSSIVDYTLQSIKMSSPMTIFATGYLLSCSTVSYTIIIYCSVRIWLRLRSDFKQTLSTSKGLSRQINAILILQVSHLTLFHHHLSN